MNRYLPSFSFGCRWGAGILVAIVFSSLLPVHSVAAGRDAVKKAVAATVAVEWRSDGIIASQPIAPGAIPAREEQAIAVDPATGVRSVRARYLAPHPPTPADLELASGVVVSADGLIVVVGREGQGTYTVHLEEGRKLSARILADDLRSGLRLLKVDAQGLPDLSLSESQPETGDPVFAAFCTDRRGRAAAQGMIAARQRPAFGGWLQLDIAVGRMSAGGPVVDDNGRLLGIVSRKQPGGPADDAAIYAVPVDLVRALMPFRHAEQTVVLHRGMLGMQVMVHMVDGRERVTAHPLPGSPAAAAGIAEGDELVAVEGEKVLTAPEVVAAVSRHTSGEKVTVTVLRDGKEHQIGVLLGPVPVLSGGTTGGGGGSTTEAEVNVVRPEQLYVLTQDGKTVAVAATKEQLEPLRTAARALRLTAVPGGSAVQPPPTANVLRVERSDLEKKLDEVGHNLETLQQQVVQLTEEIKSLRAKLADEKK